MTENEELTNFLEQLELDLESASQSEDRDERARTTLSLAPESHSQINALSSRTKISKKGVLNLTIVLLRNLLSSSEEVRRSTIEGVEGVDSEETTRKSYAISEGARSEIAELARKFEVPRHRLLERGLDLVESLINLRGLKEDA